MRVEGRCPHPNPPPATGGGNKIASDPLPCASGGGLGCGHLRAALTTNLPEYLIEAWALGMFMLSACAFTVWFEHPDSWLNHAVGNAHMRRALIGVAMGLTAIALIYSPWGQRSGAHMNPAVTLTFWGLGKVTGRNATFYIFAQFIGGTLGVLLSAGLFGDALDASTVNYAVTAPQPHGVFNAFAAEMLISFLMMSMVLHVSNSRFAKYTGVCAGILVAIFIAVEAPYSGMSMNPARTFASALPANEWSSFWIYAVAPIVAMQLAAVLFVARNREAHCAKLLHSDVQRCIHCGMNARRSI
jgi:aquaporin Z